MQEPTICREKRSRKLVDAGVLAESETEAYNYDASEDKATWEGEIGKKSYKAEYSGKTGEGYILSDDNGTESVTAVQVFWGQSRKKKKC